VAKMPDAMSRCLACRMALMMAPRPRHSRCAVVPLTVVIERPSPLRRLTVAMSRIEASNYLEGEHAISLTS